MWKKLLSFCIYGVFNVTSEFTSQIIAESIKLTNCMETLTFCYDVSTNCAVELMLEFIAEIIKTQISLKK